MFPLSRIVSQISWPLSWRPSWPLFWPRRGLVDAAAVILVVAMGARVAAQPLIEGAVERAGPQQTNLTAPALIETGAIASERHALRRADPETLRRSLRHSVVGLERARLIAAARKRLQERELDAAASQQLAVLHMLRQLSSRPIVR